MLYGGLTMEQAISGRYKIRNVCMAEIFRRIGIAEQWGTGLHRMIQGCREYGVRESESIDMGDAFRVNLYRPRIDTSIENIENFAESGTEMVSAYHILLYKIISARYNYICIIYGILWWVNW